MNNKNLDKIRKYITEDRSIFYNIAKSYIHETSKILDVGAGDGSFAKELNRKDVYMLDGNEKSAKQFADTYQNIFLGTLPDLPFENNSFDLIHCSHVIEHLEVEQLYRALKEFDRCLKIGGYIVISAPLLWTEFYDDLSHLKPYYPKVFEKYFTWKDDACCTRQRISSEYIIVDKIFRYNMLPIDDEVINISHSFLNSVIHIINKCKFKLGFRRLEKSGFTIVL